MNTTFWLLELKFYITSEALTKDKWHTDMVVVIAQNIINCVQASLLKQNILEASHQQMIHLGGKEPINRSTNMLMASLPKDIEHFGR